MRKTSLNVATCGNCKDYGVNYMSMSVGTLQPTIAPTPSPSISFSPTRVPSTAFPTISLAPTIYNNNSGPSSGEVPVWAQILLAVIGSISAIAGAVAAYYKYKAALKEAEKK